MTLNPRAIALQGIGFEVLPMALQGLSWAGYVTASPLAVGYGGGGGFGSGGRLGIYAPSRATESRANPVRLPGESTPALDFIHQQNDAIIQIMLCVAASGVLQ